MAKKKYKRICGKCKKVFYATYYNVKYCSQCLTCKRKNCNNKINYNTMKYGTGRCFDCKGKEQKITSKGKKNPFYGKHHTKNTKQIIAKLAVIRGKNKKHVINCQCCICKGKEGKYKGKNNPFYGRLHSSKTKKLMSLNHSNVSGKNNPMYGKPCPNTGKKIFYMGYYFRSTWEFLYAYFLTTKKITWKYEFYKFKIKNLTYTPDFYLPETKTYIEVKGYWRGDTKKRFNLFRKLYPKLKIILLQLNEFYKMKILDKSGRVKKPYKQILEKYYKRDNYEEKIII